MNHAPISPRAKMRWVSAAYGAVLVVSVFLVVWRYLQYRWHAEDANLYGGMWARGDMVLGVFIFRSKQLDGRLGLIHDLSRPICEPER